MKHVTVFCGSSIGTESVYKEQAYILGQLLAEAKIGLIYGGARIGLMGAVADGVLNKKGRAIGVIPKFLKNKEVAHHGLTELILVDTMHERKSRMNELSDGIIALPGGFGTLEELFEMLTWSQLGLHKKPIALLNIDGYYNPLIELIHTMVLKGFLKVVNQQMLLICNEIDEILPKMNAYIAPDVGKWMRDETI
ncbi:MAG: TIGR00730 family Rossman fold protein [Bacteroidota bacterium]|nr:TIGR00730 family Rossman fold protein [Bacteroidota bacterium]